MSGLKSSPTAAIQEQITALRDSLQSLQSRAVAKAVLCLQTEMQFGPLPTSLRDHIERATPAQLVCGLQLLMSYRLDSIQELFPEWHLDQQRAVFRDTLEERFGPLSTLSLGGIDELESWHLDEYQSNIHEFATAEDAVFRTLAQQLWRRGFVEGYESVTGRTP